MLRSARQSLNPFNRTHTFSPIATGGSNLPTPFLLPAPSPRISLTQRPTHSSRTSHRHFSIAPVATSLPDIDSSKLTTALTKSPKTMTPLEQLTFGDTCAL